MLEDEGLLRRTVSTELGRGGQGARHPPADGAPRVGGDTAVSQAAPLEVADDPCWVLLSSTGLLARTSTADPIPTEGAAGQARRDRRRGPDDRAR